MTPVGTTPGTVSASQIVEASAGTGKTRELVNQFVAMVAAGTPVEKIVAVTFTHAAAGEMKWRVRQGLDAARAQYGDSQAQACLEHALRHLDRAFIGTIHSFCAQLLRQRPVEARVDPSFRELDQGQAYAVFSGVFRAWIERKLSSLCPALERALVRLAWRYDAETRDPMKQLRDAAWTLVEWRDHSAPWEARDYDRPAELEALLAQAKSLLAMRDRRNRPEDKLYIFLQPVADFVDRATRQGGDYNLIESDLLALPREMRYPPKFGGAYGPGVTREALLAAWDAFVAAVDTARLRLDADLAVALRQDLWEVVELYRQAKWSAGQLDFMDLLLQACHLLQHDAARAYLQQRYDRILIDEFQDTDPLQAEVLLLLASQDVAQSDWRLATPKPGKLFIVGDPKQSIYRFRRADVALYRRISNALGSRGVAQRSLQSSLRSVQPIQDFVNAAFRERMPDYLPLENGRAPLGNQPSVVALPMPHPYGKRNLSKAAILQCSPDAVAAFVEWLLTESGWMVSDPANPARTTPVAAEDVCILFRRFTNWGVDLTQEYVRSLEARGIAHVLVGSKSFHQREEVGTLRTALRAIEWPGDELSVFATVRGPLFAVADGTLLKFRHEFRRMHPFRELPVDLDEEFHPVREALQLLAELHRRRNYRPIADTINHLLEYTRAHAGFAFRKGGGRVLANVYRLTDMARGFEIRGATSFRSFLDFLDDEAEGGEAAEAPLLEQQAGGVKMMTVHKAKGLEFPVVILADLTANLAGAGGEGGDRHVDSDGHLCAQKLMGCAPWQLVENRAVESKADLEEADRLAYVAATRARDLLVVTAIGDQEFEGSWLEPLYPALYPTKDRYRVAAKHAACPTQGDRTVLSRPDFEGEERSVQPGVHAARVGQHSVLWFDPSLLDLNRAKDQGLAYEDVLTGSPEAGLRAYEEWRAHRADTIRAGTQPALQVVRATEAGADAVPATIPIEVISVGRQGRGAGRVFGKLVHALLSEDATSEERSKMARSYARAFGASEADAESAAQVADAALQHPILQTAMRFGCCREMPLLLNCADGRMIEGRIDLAYLENDVWTVIEFKTDSADQMRYRRQLQVYGAALGQATGKVVRGILFEV